MTCRIWIVVLSVVLICSPAACCVIGQQDMGMLGTSEN